MRRYDWLLTALFLSCGCSARAIDVGPGAGGVAGSAPTLGEDGGGAAGPARDAGAFACVSETPLPSWPTTSDCVPNHDLPLVGTWHGYVENEPAPWDDLTLIIEGASVTGGLCGTIKIGAGPAPAPPTNPDIPYPLSTGTLPPPYESERIPGVVFTLLRGSTDGTRVRFSAAGTEGWRSWCQMQTSYAGFPGESSCGCVPSWSQRGGSLGFDGEGQCYLLDDITHARLDLNCGRLRLCQEIRKCACNAAGCDAWPGSYADFDLRFTANQAEGSVGSKPGRVHFTR